MRYYISLEEKFNTDNAQDQEHSLGLIELLRQLGVEIIHVFEAENEAIISASKTQINEIKKIKKSATVAEDQRILLF